MMRLLSFSMLAYVDPGSGSMFLQILWAVVLGAGIWFRKGLAGLLGKLTGRKQNP